ncbi:hypothetical protein SOVF_081780 [Spinacia oleracea]|uniref:Egg cell-secreted protein 1.1-like n=1 Tax=Spinacia oleracea TaxID=3562 RepID=A0ABM3RNB1_SPIOL|nr:egg cell-secreted protein 1.1-like [Spinacia oleracea]KNA17221.1 hypothetical protein SOVF_081780 [Spinacia oleracea]
MVIAKLNLLFVLILACSINMTSSSRPTPPPTTTPTTTTTTTTATAQRLNKLAGETPGGGSSSTSVNCWASMFELQSCTGEVIQFFYEGETYLGPGCCRAVRVIEHHCWPNMLATLGFTSEEGDVLQGYCDSEEDHQNGN